MTSQVGHLWPPGWSFVTSRLVICDLQVGHLWPSSWSFVTSWYLLRSSAAVIMTERLEELTSLVGHTDRVWHAAWNPRGTVLATCSSDLVRTWSIYNPESVAVRVLVLILVRLAISFFTFHTITEHPSLGSGRGERRWPWGKRGK